MFKTISFRGTASPLIRVLGLALLAVWPLSDTVQSAPAESPKTNDVLQAATQAFNFGHPDDAVALLTREIESGAGNPQLWFVRGRFFQSLGRSTHAIADFSEVVRRDPRAAAAFQLRGSERFKLGQLNEALADFNQFVKLVPQQEPMQWQRGIAFYLAGKFTEARQQFELHRQVNTNDVEAAVWLFASAARAASFDEARRQWIPVAGDSRVPMREIQDLFGGKGSAAAVLGAARGGEPDPVALVRQLFYAHYYLALNYEVTGDLAKAREHGRLAAEKYAGQDFMGDTARLHYRLMQSR